MGDGRVRGPLRVGAPARFLLASSVCIAAALAPAAGAETQKKPNFAPDALTGWQLLDDDFIPPPSGPGPVVSDPAHPSVSFYRFPRNPNPTSPLSDRRSPILLPHANHRLPNVNRQSLSVPAP